MDLITRLEKFNDLHHLIKLQRTGSPKRIAQILHVSERTVYNMIDVLRGYNAKIEYCRLRETYYYEQYVEFNFSPVVSSERLHIPIMEQKSPPV